eukprot:CAMPEP_0118686266 /NCGR_PEP_ID=MMETSP0800-20121206/7716_1 /TAXON_ID=210618 ORGANISM="Striatella unipunctata, Strain CCMP2910" /NCGR_SAMPLE_ID=MMETSP0800 /ASSEMBLY_ACC=CAM_ASM_000638 /LENGTH=406 /DNA_ID=CAMNT_0006583289 /DNA_START=35 /DNA_END=1255 /DNA_ORIENTATION=+
MSVPLHATKALRHQLRGLNNSTGLRFKSTADFTPPKVHNVASGRSIESHVHSETKDMLAMTAGVVTVSVGAVAVEQATASSVPPFDPYGQRFDQSTFTGRFFKMILACDPRLLFYSSTEVRHCQAMVENYEESPDTIENHRALWEARRIAESALHPDTGEEVPRPFRMSGFVPFNGPICVAMIASQSTVPLMFWSWINQSQNALVNYFNRNASSPLSNETLAVSYGAAVGSALAVAFGLASFIQKRYPAEQAKALLRWVSFPSAVVASSLNCYIVRRPEMDTGIPLLNDVGEDVLPGETSKEAAKVGVHLTTASRAILQLPVYFLPPALLGAVPVIKKYLSKNPAATLPITTYLLLVSFGFGLPAAVATFPQISEISVHDVEEKFQHLRDPRTGRPYEVYCYNKGL